MDSSGTKIKHYLKSLWYDASYPDSDQTKELPEPRYLKDYPDDVERIDLTPYDKLFELGDKKCFESLIERRSIRKFDLEKNLTIDQLSYLLFCTQGVKDKTKPRFRVSPTGGARCSIETYVFIDKVETIKTGLYYYLPAEHKLVCIHNKDTEELKKCLYSGNYFYSPITFIWTAIPYRLEWKYVERAYKILLLDAGHTCQNLYIACQSIGLGTCAVGAYRQQEIDSFLNIDGENEFAIYCAPVGIPKKDS